jgi:trigger factor
MECGLKRGQRQVDGRAIDERHARTENSGGKDTGLFAAPSGPGPAIRPISPLSTTPWGYPEGFDQTFRGKSELALVEGCKHELEISIPAGDVEQESNKVSEQFREKAHLKGFRAGKAPLSLVRRNFGGDIRQKVLENLVPRFLDARVQEENLRMVGSPNIVDVHFHDGEELHFKAEFEVYPEFAISEYRGVETPYAEPVVADEDIDKRLEELRETKATFANEEPRPLVPGDFAVVSLQSISGTDEPIQSDEVQVEIGGKETMPGFTENLTGAAPGDEKEFDVTYPEDYGRTQLAGKTVRFSVVVKGIRRKEKPELNDEFAQDLGDFRTVDELKEAVRKSIYAQRQTEAQRKAKDKLVDKLVDANEFAVPTVFVERQIDNRLEQRVNSLTQQGIDVKTLGLDWRKMRESMHDAAVREVRASLILGKIAESEAIAATNQEVDQEVERIARQEREPTAAMRKKLAGNGMLDRIASHIATEKTLNFLFEHATKTAVVETDEPASEGPEQSEAPEHSEE